MRSPTRQEIMDWLARHDLDDAKLSAKPMELVIARPAPVEEGDEPTVYVRAEKFVTDGDRALVSTWGGNAALMSEVLIPFDILPDDE